MEPNKNEEDIRRTVLKKAYQWIYSKLIESSELGWCDGANHLFKQSSGINKSVEDELEAPTNEISDDGFHDYFDMKNDIFKEWLHSNIQNQVTHR